MVALVAAGVLILAVAFSRNACEKVGFKWAPAWSHCVTPLCTVFHDCGHWANPSVWCDRVRPGAPEWRLIFELGEADRFDGTTAMFFSKDGETVTAELEAGHVDRLDCGPGHSWDARGLTSADGGVRVR